MSYMLPEEHQAHARRLDTAAREKREEEYQHHRAFLDLQAEHMRRMEPHLERQTAALEAIAAHFAQSAPPVPAPTSPTQRRLNDAYKRGWDALTDEQRANDPEGAPTTGERVAAIHKGLYGGTADPNRCLCADAERGRYAGTPHTHYIEPPYSCARCDCKAYLPAVPTAPATEGGEALVAELAAEREAKALLQNLLRMSQADLAEARQELEDWRDENVRQVDAAPPEAARVPTHGEARVLVEYASNSKLSRAGAELLRAYVNANEVRYRAAPQPPVAEGGTRDALWAVRWATGFLQAPDGSVPTKAFDALVAKLHEVDREARSAALPDGAREALAEWRALDGGIVGRADALSTLETIARDRGEVAVSFGVGGQGKTWKVRADVHRLAARLLRALAGTTL